MKNCLFLPVILVFVFSCAKQPLDNTIRPLQTASGSFTAKVTGSVPLSNKSNALIDNIYMIDYYKERVFVFDEGERNMMIFSSEGNLVNKLVRGKGPGELVEPMGFSCFQNRLIITDAFLVKYFTLDGKYLQTKKLPAGCFATCVTQLASGNFLTYGMSPDFSKELKADYLSNQFYYFHVLDSTLTEEILPLVPLPMEVGGMERGKTFHSYKNHYILAEGIGNKLLIFDGEKVLDSYTIDFERYAFTNEELKNTKYAYIDLILSGTRFGLIEKVNETKDLITFSYSRKGTDERLDHPTVLCSKETGKTADFSEVLKASGLPEVELMNTRGDELLCLLHPSDFTKEQLQHFWKLGYISTEVAPDSNPVVIFIRVKEK